MRSPSESSMQDLQHNDRLIAGYAAIAVVIHVLEAAFPSPIPGVKPGLANVINLIVLLRYSWSATLWVGGLRVLVGSLLVGSFMAPGFWLSASGAAASLLALGLGLLWNRSLPTAWEFSAIGLALLSACAHMIGQFAVAYFWFVPHEGLLRLLPVLLSAALIFGVISGLVANAVLQRLALASPAGQTDT